MCPKLLKTVWFGSFVLDGDTVVDKVLFPADPESIAERLLAISKDQPLAEEQQLIKEHRPENTSEPRLVDLGLALYSSDFSPNPAENGFPPDMLAKASRKLATMKTKEAVTPDLYLIQALGTYDTLLEIKNLLGERLRNYYALHWPELIDLVPESRYTHLISEYGDKDGIASANEPDLPGDDLASDAPEGDVQALKDLAELIEEMGRRRDGLESHISAQMRSVCPNLAAVTGPLVGARLISLAGSLERLARLPSSTVQILGAEKAMFRSKKENAKQPKHGVIFVHPFIRTAPHWRRGKIARALAGKASIAAKVDFNKGEFVGDSLKADLERKVESINQRYPSQPRKS